MAFDTSSFKKSTSEIITWLESELQSVRTGRASPNLLDSVEVEVYGTRMPLMQVGGINVESARSLYITPYDKSQIKAIENAIQVANLGVGVGSDDKGVRVSFPELTGERRQQLVKLVKSKLEDARVSLKGERNNFKGTIDAAKKAGTLSEDGAAAAEADMQKIVNEVQTKLESIADRKETELLS